MRGLTKKWAGVDPGHRLFEKIAAERRGPLPDGLEP